MTRKECKLIAAALNDTLLINLPTLAHLEGARAAHASAALGVAAALAKINPRFDGVSFMAACGV